MFKEESKIKSTKSVIKPCATQTGRLASFVSGDSSELSPRRLSIRDSRLLTEHIAKPTKPNAALKAAARKYW